MSAVVLDGHREAEGVVHVGGVLHEVAEEVAAGLVAEQAQPVLEGRSLGLPLGDEAARGGARGAARPARPSTRRRPRRLWGTGWR